MPPPRPTVTAGRPWRTGLPSAGSTVVERPKGAATALAAPTIPLAQPAMAPLPTAVPMAAPVAAPSPPAAMPAEDDWSRLFDDSDSGKAPARSGNRFRLPAGVAVWRRHWRILVGAGAGVLLLIGGVWLVLALLPAQPKPAPPVHLRAAMQGDAIGLAWDDPSGLAAGFRVERAADRQFTKDLISFPVGRTPNYSDGRLAASGSYYYRVRALRGPAESAPSNTAWPAPDYGSNGFAPFGLVLNGGATVADGVLHLTDANPGEARSAFFRQEQDVRAFRTKFRFRIGAGPQTADGFTFCVQNAGPTALGQSGGGLGYQDVPKSVAVKFDLWDNDGEGPNSTGLFQGGAKPSNPGSVDLTRAGVDLHGGRPCDVVIDYKDGKLSLFIADVEDAKRRFEAAFAVDVPKAVGGPTAWVGFTGGTGGMGAAQDVLSWSWESTSGGD